MKPTPLGGLSSRRMSRRRRRSSSSLDLARDADAAQRRHQHQVAAGDADVGGERRALGADAFLDDLDEHFVAAAEDFLNRRLDSRADAEPLRAASAGPATTAVAASTAARMLAAMFGVVRVPVHFLAIASRRD